MPRTVCICDGPEQLAERSAAHIAAAARDAVAQRGRFTIALSGGDTPVATYARLADQLAAEVPWEHVHVFWGDERCIPLERPDNHFTMATGTMLGKVPIPAANVHRARGEAEDPSAAAAEYEQILRDCFDGAPVPVFDLILLGMGEDGHVASLFPGSAGWGVRDRWVVDHYVLKRGERARRLSLTMPVLTAAREVMLLVSGEIKADMLGAVLRGEADVPASELDGEASEIVWMVDRAAAAALEPAQVGARR